MSPQEKIGIRYLACIMGLDEFLQGHNRFVRCDVNDETGRGDAICVSQRILGLLRRLHQFSLCEPSEQLKFWEFAILVLLQPDLDHRRSCVQIADELPSRLGILQLTNQDAMVVEVLLL